MKRKGRGARRPADRQTLTRDAESMAERILKSALLGLALIGSRHAGRGAGAWADAAEGDRNHRNQRAAGQGLGGDRQFSGYELASRRQERRPAKAATRRRSQSAISISAAAPGSTRNSINMTPSTQLFVSYPDGRREGSAGEQLFVDARHSCRATTARPAPSNGMARFIAAIPTMIRRPNSTKKLRSRRSRGLQGRPRSAEEEDRRSTN